MIYCPLKSLAMLKIMYMPFFHCNHMQRNRLLNDPPTLALPILSVQPYLFPVISCDGFALFLFFDDFVRILLK